jgi:dTMP kinase
MRGRLITFEGIDGAGKSTHLPRCAALLRDKGLEVLVTREPGGTELAEQIRDWFLRHDTDADTEVLLAFAARSDHLARIIRPALAAGKWIICDRFTDSTVAYQGGGRQLGKERVEQIERWLHPDLQPDRTYLFDLQPEEAARRRAKARAADRFEAQDAAFFKRVRDAYRARAGTDAASGAAGGPRILTIDAGGDPAQTWKLLEEDLLTCLGNWISR